MGITCEDDDPHTKNVSAVGSQQLPNIHVPALGSQPPPNPATVQLVSSLIHRMHSFLQQPPQSEGSGTNGMSGLTPLIVGGNEPQAAGIFGMLPQQQQLHGQLAQGLHMNPAVQPLLTRVPVPPITMQNDSKLPQLPVSTVFLLFIAIAFLFCSFHSVVSEQ